MAGNLVPSFHLEIVMQQGKLWDGFGFSFPCPKMLEVFLTVEKAPLALHRPSANSGKFQVNTP